jgi:hypothetical protein
LDKACQQKTSLIFTQHNIKLNIKGRWSQQRTLKDFWVGETGTDKLMMMMMMMMTMWKSLTLVQVVDYKGSEWFDVSKEVHTKSRNYTNCTLKTQHRKGIREKHEKYW